jgi:hypothetical protein
MAPAPVLGFAETLNDVSNVTSLSYAFSIHHEPPNEDEEHREIKMSGTSVLAFPMNLNEFAYAMPNSKFVSAGANSGQALTKPTFSANRTIESHIRYGDGESVPIPAHEFTTTSDANCTLTVSKQKLPGGNSPYGALFANSVFQYANEVNRRFSWMAIEKARAKLKFTLNREIPLENSLETQTLKITSSEHMVPRSVTVEELNYAAVSSDAMGEFIVGILSKMETGMFDKRTRKMDSNTLNEMRKTNKGYVEPDLPARLPAQIEGKQMWDEDNIYEIIYNRIGRWNKYARDTSEVPAFRKEIRNVSSGTAGSAQVHSLTHTFFRPTGGRRTSQLIRCEIKLTEYKDTERAEALDGKDPTGENITTMLNGMSKKIPDSNKSGVRNPLFQRFRLIMASSELRQLLMRAIDANSVGDMKKLVSECASSRVLPALVEAVALLVSMRTTMKTKPETIAKHPALGWVLQGPGRIFEDTFRTMKSALEVYPKFLEYADKLSKTESSNAMWILNGGTRASVSLSISMTAHTFGKYPNSFRTVSLPTPNSYLPALAACIGRIVYDPSVQGIDEFFPRN